MKSDQNDVESDFSFIFKYLTNVFFINLMLLLFLFFARYIVLLFAQVNNNNNNNFTLKYTNVMRLGIVFL